MTFSPKYQPSSFAILIVFILLMIVGISLLPLLNMQLTPSRSLPGLSVSYRWADASAGVIEQEVTSKLEWLFSGVKGIKGVSLVSSKGRGKSLRYTSLGNIKKAVGSNTQANQKEKVVGMENKVMVKEIKSEMTAIQEIQEEMRKIIEKSEAEILNENNIHTGNNLNPIYNGTKEGAYCSVVLTDKFMLQKW